MAPGRYCAHLDDSWHQGRGAYGGLVGAVLASAMEQHVADPRRRIRSLTLHFAAPVQAGPLDVETITERFGSYVTQVSVRARQGTDVVAFGTATCAGDRPPARGAGLTYADAHRPDCPSPDRVRPMADHPLMPAFTKHFEYRPCLGAQPFAGASRSELGGWIRPRVSSPWSVGLLVALLDAFPPAVLTRSSDFRPAASVDMNTHIFSVPDEPAPMGEFLLLHAVSRWAHAGYADERARLFRADGTCLAECQQWVAVLG